MELIASFVAGFAAAGVVLVINMVTGNRLPKWVMPVAAGVTMIGFAIWSEYSWAGRTKAALPEGVEVIDTVEVSRFWKPWTYVVPQTTRIMAADVAAIRENDSVQGARLVDLYLFERWQAPGKVMELVRCDDPARALATEAALADPEEAAKWLPVTRADPIYGAVCTD
ncbi:hypothetical protein [Roseovarius sp. MMSF_3281]|uniref:hypothetical protein n=1 Tax=Roseovarius sp. MMSF_3281 TaxID=3046694 RepID=UPI00273E2114|nr:hypothetical protein [Roseovarius sp. MMSF_3281]